VRVSGVSQTFAPPVFDELEEPDEEVSPAAGLVLSGVSKVCPDCDKTITAKTELGANIQLGKHRGKVHGIKNGKVSVPTEPKTEKEKPRRKNGSEILALVASGLGSLVSISSPAAGLALKLEAPLVGPAADKAVAGTVVDRMVLQRALQAKGKFDAIGPLIAFPILVGICEKQPAMRPQLYGPLRMCITPMLADLVKAMQKQAADNEKLAKAAADLSDLDPGFAALFADGVDPVDAILGTLFPPEEPDEAV
jgi:hypothetical protein